MAFSTTTAIQASAPATDSANITGSGTNIQPWFAVGEGGYDGTFSYAKIYVPAGGNATLTVIQGNGVCGIDLGSPEVNYEADRLDPSENLGGQVGGTQGNTGGCGALTFPLSGGVPSNRTGHAGFDVYYFQATIRGPGFGDNEKNFRLSVNNGGLIGVSRPVANLGTKPWFGIYMRDAPSRGGNNWDYAVQTASYCNEDPAINTKSIAVHDIDWQVYNQPNLEGLVDKDDRAAPGYNWQLAPPGTPSSRKLQNDWPAGDHSDANLTFAFSNTYRYLLEFRDIDWHNTIQVALPFDQFDSRPSVGQACNSPPLPNASCTANGQANLIVNNMGIGQTLRVDYIFTNKGTTAWTPTDNPLTQYRRTVNGTSFSPTTVPRNIPPGGTFTVTVTETAPTIANSTKTISYTMWQSGVGPFGSSCSANLSTGRGIIPGGSITVNCSQTAVSGLTTTATYPTSTTTFPGTYQTYQKPINYPTQPYIFASPPPPPAGSPFLPGVPTYSYTPPPVIVNSTPPATIIPIQIHFDGSDGSSQIYTDTVPNPGGGKAYDTFTDFQSQVTLWPHLNYTVTLWAQTSGSLGANQAGPYTYTQVDQKPLPPCLSGSCSGGLQVDAEPGQRVQFSYVVNMANQTNANFSDNNPNGYSFTPNVGGGITAPNGVNASPDITPSSNPNINVTFTARVDYTGTFSVTFMFKGSPLTLVGLNPATCPGVSITPQTRPFFQVSAGDLNAGGGFGNPSDGQCTLGNPGYISPITNNNTQDGGIAAFGNQSAGRGSRGDFGVLALGYNIGSSGGPVGLFSGHNEVLAGPPFAGNSLGGLLNPTTFSQWHCANDFFTKTRKVNPGPSSFGGGSVPGASLQYFANGPINISASTINAGQQTTIYVDGDVTITGDIVNAPSWDATNRLNVPFFSLIVRGNIYLSPNVTQLDGLFVAQPRSAGTGIFATCNGFCNRRLIVNGAVLAQQVELLREVGTLGPLEADINNITTGPAEVFNYTPAMIIGQPNFNPNYSPLESIFSLPPVF